MAQHFETLRLDDRVADFKKNASERLAAEIRFAFDPIPDDSARPDQ